MKIRQTGRRRNVTLQLPEPVPNDGGQLEGQPSSKRCTKRPYAMVESDEEFRGFSPEPPLPSSREAHPILLRSSQQSVPDSNAQCPTPLRRSTRSKEKKVDDNYVY